MAKLEDLQKRILTIREVRDWKQFHNPKDSALSLVLEAAEVMEHFQWKNAEEMAEHIKLHKKDIGDELADVMYWVLVMSHDFGINILDAIDSKLGEIERKYPIEKAKGKHTKYNKL